MKDFLKVYLRPSVWWWTAAMCFAYPYFESLIVGHKVTLRFWERLVQFFLFLAWNAFLEVYETRKRVKKAIRVNWDVLTNHDQWSDVQVYNAVREVEKAGAIHVTSMHNSKNERWVGAFCYGSFIKVTGKDPA